MSLAPLLLLMPPSNASSPSAAALLPAGPAADPAAEWKGQAPALLPLPPLLLLLLLLLLFLPAWMPMAARRRCRMARSCSSRAACSRCDRAWFHGSCFILRA